MAHELQKGLCIVLGTKTQVFPQFKKSIQTLFCDP